MGTNKWRILTLAACILVCNAQPTKVPDLPVLKEQPSELLYKIGATTLPLVLECLTVSPTNEQQIEYTWQKNGQPFDFRNKSDIIQRQSNEGTLIFSKPTVDTEGEYQCFAQSEAGTASTRPISVKMAYVTPPKAVTPLKHTPVEGKPFKLECTITEAYPKPAIIWMRQHSSDKLNNKDILDKRITIGPEGTLYFTNVTKDDVSKEYMYVCVVASIAAEPIIAAEHFIEDVVENKDKNGELVPLYLSQDMVAKVGDVTMIYCIYGGTPLAHPDWYFEGKNVNNKPSDRITRYNRSAGKRLLIKETIASDQGTYTCEVNNGVGETQNHSMHLTVYSLPEYVKKPLAKMIVREGQDVTIPCQIKGVEAAKATWTYNAQPLTTSERVAVKNGSVDGATVADLTIKKVQASDNGYYGCKGVNSHGNVYAETLVYVA